MVRTLLSVNGSKAKAKKAKKTATKKKGSKK
jgi:hypothetical protein